MRGKTHIESFEDAARKERAITSIYLGLKDVELDKIVGSFGRYQDFLKNFVPLSSVVKDKVERMKKLMIEEDLPPIELYKIKDKYYVVDGNHRVAAAKALGFKSIPAYVTEYLPPADNEENILLHERSMFEKMTGLDIKITEPGKYKILLNQIEEHKKHLLKEKKFKPTLKEAALSWYYKVYLPIVKIIRKIGILERFPGRTEGDLFIYICNHKWFESEKQGRDIGFERAIESFLKLNNYETGIKYRNKFINFLYRFKDVLGLKDNNKTGA